MLSMGNHVFQPSICGLTQSKLRSAFLYHSHVFLFFSTNRSYEIKGLARMEKEPVKVSEKSFWEGVSNIRLGGNF
jgi:hypothetical protein